MIKTGLIVAFIAACALFASPALSQTNDCAICKDIAVAGHYLAELEGWNSTQLLAEIDQVCKFLGTYQVCGFFLAVLCFVSFLVFPVRVPPRSFSPR
jgi:hypothetical protein